MPFTRMTATLASALLALATSSSFAATAEGNATAPWDTAAAWAIASADTPLPMVGPTATVIAAAIASGENAAADASRAPADASPSIQLRQLLADFSLTLRDIRYRRGGHDPVHGFDCSGFVRYVFRHSLGQDLPHSSASQYRIGATVARGAMKVGDLVFFRTHGKRISHVGIYLGDGRFIHSPSSGKRVSISNLDERYWSRRFAGAKRPSVLS